MSEDMVRRVADAIAAASTIGTNDFEDLARAAIEAMRSPNETMVEAAHAAEPNPVLGGYGLEEGGPNTIWQAMIDAALSPKGQSYE